jgi:hypothetical protein
MSGSIIKFLALLFFSNQVFLGISQKVYYVGIPASKMNYVASSQNKPQWCWAASIQMLLNFYGVSINQEQIVERTYGRQSNGELPNWAASIKTIHLNLNNWAVDNTGKKYFVNADFGLGAPEAVFLIEELSQKRPVIIAYQSNKGGHVVVITALSYIDSDAGPLINSIIVRDPMTGEENKPNSGRVEYDAITLAKRITAYWFVKVMVSTY